MRTESRGLRILWYSFTAGPEMPTGYGNVTRAVCGGLTHYGHEVHVLGLLKHRSPSTRSTSGLVLHPKSVNTGMGDILRTVKPSVIVLLGNMGWLPVYLSADVLELARESNIPIAFYTPVDGNTADGQLPKEWVDLLRLVDRPVAMSRYGHNVMRASGIEADYIPHGVDLNIFSPPWSRELAKARLGYQDKFVVLSDSRNQPRKLLPRLLEVFALFVEKHPNAILHLHTDPHDEILSTGAYSYSIGGDAINLGVADRVYLTSGFAIDQGGIPLKKLARYYQAADVHILTSGGEGFGLPTLQAAATGTVPMACAYSANVELTQGHGEPLPVSAWVETPVGIRRALMDVRSAADRLGDYCVDRELLLARSLASRKFAEKYAWHHIVPQWDRMLRSLATLGATREVHAVSVPPLLSAFPDQKRTVYTEGIQLMNHHLRSEVRIPAAPTGRPTGHVLLGFDDIELLFKLRNLFPIFFGWIVGREKNRIPAALGMIHIEASDLSAQYHVLRWCSLVLNTSGALSLDVLRHAASLGVPCIGSSARKFQIDVWPELVADNADSALRLSRKILTDPALYAELSARGDAAGIVGTSTQSAYHLDRLAEQSTR